MYANVYDSFTNCTHITTNSVSTYQSIPLSISADDDEFVIVHSNLQKKIPTTNHQQRPSPAYHVVRRAQGSQHPNGMLKGLCYSLLLRCLTPTQSLRPFEDVVCGIMYEITSHSSMPFDVYVCPITSNRYRTRRLGFIDTFMVLLVNKHLRQHMRPSALRSIMSQNHNTHTTYLSCVNVHRHIK